MLNATDVKGVPKISPCKGTCFRTPAVYTLP